MINRVMWAALAVAIGCVGLAGQAAADEAEMRAMVAEAVKAEMAKQGGDEFRVYWKDGLRLESGDGGKTFKGKIGGRIMLDAWVFDDDELKDDVIVQPPFAPGVPGSYQEDGVEFRRVRLYNSGLIHDHVEYKLQLDFAHGDVSFRDVYFGLTHLKDCWGCAFPSIRVGHQFQPISLEANTSSKYITFMERSFLANTFGYASRATGIKIHDSLMGDHLNYQFAFFSPTSSPGGGGDFDFDDGWAVAGRVTYAPWWDCNCSCKRAHVGISGAYYDDLKGRRFRSRAPSHMTSRYVNTGTISDVESYTTLGFEGAVVYGPWSVQGEYLLADVDSDIAGDPTYTAWYVYASYWLTGECRNYKHGAFSRTKPCCNFLDNDCCCTGGWELAARYEGIDLSDGNVDGGEMTAFTFGVNWHLNPNARIMLNYFIATIDGTPAGFNVLQDANPGVAAASGVATFDDTTFSGFGIRFQVDW